MKTPLELVQSLLSNPTNIENVRGLTTEDVCGHSLDSSFGAAHESAFGPKRTSWSRSAMSAFGGKADIARTF